MTILEEYNQKHQKAIERLQKVANPKTFKYGVVKSCEVVAANLGTSSQTIMNYISGRTKDGYLTEAITKEFKNLKIDLP